jgi:hypothetical protein
MSDTNLIAFLDNIGRTLIGTVASETDTVLAVQNPAIVVVQPNSQTNQLQLQLIPVFFKEFLEDKGQPLVWNFNKNQITRSSDLAFASQFVNQYENMWRPFVPPSESEPSVVKLFDE